MLERCADYMLLNCPWADFEPSVWWADGQLAAKASAKICCFFRERLWGHFL